MLLGLGELESRFGDDPETVLNQKRSLLGAVDF